VYLLRLLKRQTELQSDEATFNRKKEIIQKTRELTEQNFAQQIEQIQSRTDEEIRVSELIAETDAKRLNEKVRLLKLDEIEETRLLEIIKERKTNLQDLAAAEKEINTERVEDIKAFNESVRALEIEQAQNNAFEKLRIQKETLNEERSLAIENAKRLGQDTTRIVKFYNDKEIELERLKQQAKLALGSELLGSIAQFAGQGTAIGKAAAVAQTVIDTYVGAQKAFTSQLVPGDPTSFVRASSYLVTLHRLFVPLPQQAQV